MALEEAVTTIVPPPAFSMCGISYFMARKTPRRLVLLTRSHSSALYSCSGFSMVMPALLKADVQPAIGADRGVDEGADLVFDQDVGLHVERLAAHGLDLALDLLAELGPAATERDLAAFGREGEGSGPANAGGGAGDGDHLAVEAAPTRLRRYGR